MDHFFFMCSSVKGHLPGFQVLVIENISSMNIVICVSFWIMVLFGYIPRSGMAELHGTSIFSFSGNWHTILHRLYRFTLTWMCLSPSVICLFIYYLVPQVEHKYSRETLRLCFLERFWDEGWLVGLFGRNFERFTTQKFTKTRLNIGKGG